MVPASVNDKYIIRFCAVAQNATEEDIDYAWDVIQDFAAEILEKEQADELTEIMDRKRKETLAQKRSFSFAWSVIRKSIILQSIKLEHRGCLQILYLLFKMVHQPFRLLHVVQAQHGLVGLWRFYLIVIMMGRKAMFL